MRLKTPAPDVLSAEMTQLLLEGPHALGKTLWEIPDHDTLRRLWQQHGAALRARQPRGREIWFELRDDFVRVLRREP